ncbi:MAG: CheR family methyltransferase [Planctomycetota bacterium]
MGIDDRGFLVRPAPFECLAGDLLPGVLRDVRNGLPLAVLSIGGADGIEAMTAGITLLSVFGSWAGPPPIVALRGDGDGEDWNPSSIYPASAVRGLAGPVKRRFFRCGYGEFSGAVKVRDEVRWLIRFESWTDFLASQGEDLFDIALCHAGLVSHRLDRVIERLRPGGHLVMEAIPRPFRGQALVPVGENHFRREEAPSRAVVVGGVSRHGSGLHLRGGPGDR